MRKILIIGLTLIGLTGCNNRENQSNNIVVDTKDIKIEKICDYQQTPRGVSIITISDGKRFIYFETGDGVAVTQIMENGEVSPIHTELTPTDTIINY